MPAPSKPAYLGLRRWYPNPITGGHTGVYDGRESGDDTDGGRWQVVCEEHGTLLSVRTFDDARFYGNHGTDEFCDDCRSIVEAAR